MRIRYIKKNILYFPTIDIRYLSEVGSRKYCGDIHSNPLTAYNFFLGEGIYERPAELYYEIFRKTVLKPIKSITRDDIRRFDSALQNTKVRLAGLFRFLGDDFSDRVGCDIYMAKIHRKADLDKANIRTTLSNHIIALLMARQKNGRYEPYDIPAEYCVSLVALQELIDKGVLIKEEVDELIDNHVIPHIDVFDACFVVDANGKEWSSFFSHGKNDDDDVYNVAHQFEIKADFSNKEKVKTTLKLITEKLQEAIREKKLESILLDQGQPTPIYLAIWSRHAKDRKYKFILWDYYANGHDGEGKLKIIKMVDMDNEAGKKNLLSYDSEFVIFEHSSPQVYEDIQTLKNQIISSSALSQLLIDESNQIDKLISEKTIFSSQQVNFLKKMLFADDGVELWNELLGNDLDLKVKFINVAVNHGNPILDILAQLKFAGILTKTTFQKVLKTPVDHLEELYQVFLVLMQTGSGLLNQKNFHLVMEHIFDYYPRLAFKKVSTLKKVFIECRHNKTLNDDSIQEIIINAKRPNFLPKLKMLNLIEILLPHRLSEFEELDEDTLFKMRKLLKIYNEHCYLNNEALTELLEVHFLKKTSLIKVFLNIFNLLKFNRVSFSHVLLLQLLQASDSSITCLNYFLKEYSQVISYEKQLLQILNCSDVFADFINYKIKINKKDIRQMQEYGYNFPDICYVFVSYLRESENFFQPQMPVFSTENINEFFSNPIPNYLLLYEFRQNGILEIPVIQMALELCRLKLSDYVYQKLFNIRLRCLRTSEDNLSLDRTLLVNNSGIYIFNFLPLLHQNDLLTKENIEFTLQHFNCIDKIIFLLKFFPQPSTITMDTIKKMTIIAPHFLSVDEVFAQYGLLGNNSNEIFHLKTKYFNSLIHFQDIIYVINRIIIRSGIKDIKFFELFLDNLSKDIDFINYLKSFSKEERRVEGFVTYYALPHLEMDPQFTNFFNGNRTFYSPTTLNLGLTFQSNQTSLQNTENTTLINLENVPDTGSKYNI